LSIIYIDVIDVIISLTSSQITSKKEYGTLTDYFKYELSSYPLSLFDKNCDLRKANKSELAKEIGVMCTYDPGKEKMSTRRAYVRAGWGLVTTPLVMDKTR
jgi:hypothetical protein